MRVLAFGAHPDDIELGCGGALARWARAGAEVVLCVATRGEIGGLPEVRAAEQERARVRLGAARVIWGELRDTHLGADRALLLRRVREILASVDPTIVLVHALEDTHQDHRALGQAVVDATARGTNLLFYEGPSTDGFSPRLFIDITATWPDKLASVEEHGSQIEKPGSGPDLLSFATTCGQFRGRQALTSVAEGFVPHTLLGLDLWMKAGARGAS